MSKSLSASLFFIIVIVFALIYYSYKKYRRESKQNVSEGFDDGSVNVALAIFVLISPFAIILIISLYSSISSSKKT